MSVEVIALENAMQELLAALADPQSVTVAATWKRCQLAEQELKRFLAGPLPTEEKARAELTSGLLRLARLNAIARQNVAREQETLADHLVESKQSSAKIKAYSGRHEATGNTCDFAG